MALSRSTAAPSPISKAELFRALARKSHELRDRQKALVGRIIELEHDGIEESLPAAPSEHQNLVRELVNGYAPPIPEAGHPGEQLRSLRIEVRAIDSAMQVLQSEEVKARAAALGEVMAERKEDWLEICRARAMAIIELRKSNRRAEAFRKEVTRKGGMLPSLVCDRQGGQVFAAGVSDQGYQFLQDCVKYKILTAKEVGDVI